MSCGIQDDISIVRQTASGEKDQGYHRISSFENCSMALKRKINPREERKPNIPVRRKIIAQNDMDNSNTSMGSNKEQLLSHLKEHLIVRHGHGHGHGDEDEEEEEEYDEEDGMQDAKVPPQNYMEPVVPPAERFGLDLTPTLHHDISSLQPVGWFGQKPEPSRVTDLALALFSVYLLTYKQ